MNLLPEPNNDACLTGLKQRGFKFPLPTNEQTGLLTVEDVRAVINDVAKAYNSSIESCLEDGAFILASELDVYQPSESDAKPLVRLIITRKDRMPQ